MSNVRPQVHLRRVFAAERALLAFYASVRRALAALLLAPILLVVGCGEVDRWPSTSFSSPQWRQTAESGRFVFVKDLIASGVLVGKSRDDVLALLGPPSAEQMAPRGMDYLVKVGGTGLNQVFVLRLALLGPQGQVSEAWVGAD